MLDTGPLISLYNHRDARGKDVACKLKEIQQLKYPVCITLPTIAEAHRRILYDVNGLKARTFLRDITDGTVQILQVTQEDITSAIEIIDRYDDQALTYTDAICMAVMKRYGIIKVLSFDLNHFCLVNFYPVPISSYS